MKTSTTLVVSLGLACLPLALAHAHSPNSHLKRNLKRSPQNYGSGGAYGGAMGGGMGGMSEMGGMGGDAMSEQVSASESMSMGMDMSASLGMSGMSEMATPTESAMGAAESAIATIQGAMGSMGPSLDMCVQQCMASNGLSWPSGVASAALPALTGTPMMAPMPSGSGTMVNGSLVGGPGQVVVAPKKGDLRFVPFNTVASPGQTVEFIWGAGPHTVTQSSQLSICNATQQAGAFKSGMQQAGFQMPLTVNDSSTIFYYCAVPNHCQKGMFGLINGQVSLDGKNTFGEYMNGWAKASQENQDLLDITIQITSGNSAAANWGESLSTAQFESWALPWAMQQIMYTRQYFAENPQLLAATAGNATSPTTSAASNAGSPASTSSAASASASASESSGAASSNKAAGALALIGVALALLA